MGTTSSEKLKGFFHNLVRQSFSQLGVHDQPVTEYIADILSDFSRSERWLALRGADGRPPDQCGRDDARPRRS